MRATTGDEDEGDEDEEEYAKLSGRSRQEFSRIFVSETAAGDTADNEDNATRISEFEMHSRVVNDTVDCLTVFFDKAVE